MIWIGLITLGLLLVAMAIYIARRHSTVELAQLDTRTIPVDLAAFDNLRNPADTAFLREQLDPPTFRRVQRLRTLAALEYVSRIASNAYLLQRVGETTRRSADTKVAATSESIVEQALRLRLLTLRVRVQLYLEWLNPERSAITSTVSEQYDRVRWRLALLLSARAPLESSRILAAL